jgi:phage-related minor tail protein
MGGPVSAGRTYLVGERGPELFTPQGGGQIVPNHQLGAGGGQTVQIINMGAPEGVREAGRSKGPDGREIVKVIVGEELGRGGFNKQMNGLYGVSPTKVRR